MCGLMMAAVMGLKRGSTVMGLKRGSPVCTALCFMFPHAVNRMVKLLVAYGTGSVLSCCFSKSKFSSMSMCSCD